MGQSWTAAMGSAAWAGNIHVAVSVLVIKKSAGKRIEVTLLSFMLGCETLRNQWLIVSFGAEMGFGAESKHASPLNTPCVRNHRLIVSVGAETAFVADNQIGPVLRLQLTISQSWIRGPICPTFSGTNPESGKIVF